VFFIAAVFKNLHFVR